MIALVCVLALMLLSCLHADAAALKMDMCVFVCVRAYAEAAYPQMDVETVAPLRTERRHLEETFQGRRCQ